MQTSNPIQDIMYMVVEAKLPSSIGKLNHYGAAYAIFNTFAEAKQYQIDNKVESVTIIMEC